MTNHGLSQMLMLLTRIGFGSKLVIIGDPEHRLVVSDEISLARLTNIYRSKYSRCTFQNKIE